MKPDAEIEEVVPNPGRTLSMRTKWFMFILTFWGFTAGVIVGVQPLISIVISKPVLETLPIPSIAVLLIGIGIALVGLLVTWTIHVRNPAYSALLAASCFFITLVVAAFLVTGETAASRYARASRHLNRSTSGTFTVDFEENIPQETVENLLSQIEYSAKASGFDYMVRRIVYTDVTVGNCSVKVPVVGVRGALPPGKGWRELKELEVFVTDGMATGSEAKANWRVGETVLVEGTRFKAVGFLRDVVPLLNPSMQEGLLSFDLEAWNGYLVMGMDDWTLIFRDKKSVLQVVVRDQECYDDPSFYPDKNQLYATLNVLRDWSDGAVRDWRWHLPKSESANLFRLVAYSLSSIVIVSGAVAVFSSANSITLLRSREIGVMRSIGADVGQVRRLFLREVGFLALVGGLPGAIIGTAISLPILVGLSMQTSIGIMVTQGGVALLVCLVVALLSSSLCFLRIVRKWPAEVLRWSGGFALR